METRGNTAKTTALKMGLAGANFAQIAAGGKLPDGFHLLRFAECFEVTPEETLGVKMRVKLDSNPPPDAGTAQRWRCKPTVAAQRRRGCPPDSLRECGPGF
jgi:hypothetical protein